MTLPFRATSFVKLGQSFDAHATEFFSFSLRHFNDSSRLFTGFLRFFFVCVPSFLWWGLFFYCAILAFTHLQLIFEPVNTSGWHWFFFFVVVMEWGGARCGAIINQISVNRKAATAPRRTRKIRLKKTKTKKNSVVRQTDTAAVSQRRQPLFVRFHKKWTKPKRRRFDEKLGRVTAVPSKMMISLKKKTAKKIQSPVIRM